MKRCACALMLLSILCLLTGCTRTADRIYTVCRVSEKGISTYKPNGTFYDYHEDGSLTPSMDPTLRALPALQFNPRQHSYKLTPVLPGLWEGTLQGLEGYVYELTQNGFTFDGCTYADWQKLEFYVYSDDDTYRIMYNIYGEVRIYSQNKAPILYLNEEEN